MTETDLTRRSDSELIWRNYTLVLLTVLLSFRVLYIAIVPLNLIADEAYYWDWSRQLAWGYFSKPPMIAWLIHLSTSIGGDTEFFVRLPAALLSVAGLYFVYLTAANLYSPKVGFRSVLLLALTPGAAAGAMLMTIDAPLLFLWSVSLYCGWKLMTSHHVVRWTIATGLTVGLGLLAKQTMVAFPAALALFVFSDAVVKTAQSGLRNALQSVAGKAASVAVVLCMGALMFVPVLIWNSHNDWIMFEHTKGHFSESHASLIRCIIRPLEFLGGQMGVLSPVTFVALVVAQAAILVHFRSMDRRTRYLLSTGTLPLCAVIGLSVIRQVNLNWPAPFFVATVISTTAWLSAPGRFSTWKIPRLLAPELRSHALRRCVVGGVITVVLTLALPFTVHLARLNATPLDPTRRLRGWKEVAGEIDRVRNHHLPDHGASLICDTGRQEVSELAFYLPDHPRVYHWNPGDAVRSQYDIWGVPQDVRQQNALILTAAGAEPNPGIRQTFGSLQRLDDVLVPLGNGVERHYSLWKTTPRMAGVVSN